VQFHYCYSKLRRIEKFTRQCAFELPYAACQEPSCVLWPHVTVATIIEERNGRFLMVEEARDQPPVLNQPAGHVEEDESLIPGPAQA